MRLVPVVVLLLACGDKAFCKRMAEASCVEPTDAELDECEEQLAPCSSDDKRAIDESYDCLEKEGLISCDDESETVTLDEMEAEMSAMLACMGPMFGVSEECAGAMSGTDDSTLTFSSYRRLVEPPGRR